MEIGRRSVSLDPVFAYSKKLRPPHMTISSVEKEIDENTFQVLTLIYNLYFSITDFIVRMVQSKSNVLALCSVSTKVKTFVI